MKILLKIVLIIIFCDFHSPFNYVYGDENFGKLLEKKCGSLRQSERCDLSNINLSKRVLKKANLRGVNLSNTNLSNTDLSNTDLSGSVMYHANLSGSNLQNTNFSSTNLSGANLFEANITGIIFDKNTILCNTKMPNGIRFFSNCSGEKVYLQDADLENLNLSKVDFTGSIMHRAHLAYSNLEEANLSSTILWSADLTGANLTGANLSNTQFNKKTILCNTMMPNGKRLFKNCKQANLKGANLRKLNLNGLNLVEADLTGADLRGAKLVGANLKRANLTGVKMNGSELYKAKLEGAILCQTTLSDCRGSDYFNANKLINEVNTAYTNGLSLIRGRHYSAYAIDNDINGNLYIGNYRKNEILILDKNLNKKYLIKNTPMPHGITVDKSGVIYVATFMHGRVLKFNKNLDLVPEWDLKLREGGLLKQPITLATDELNNVYIGDYTGNIYKVNSEGKMITAFERQNEPYHYHGLSIFNKKLYVAARSLESSLSQGKIKVFDLDGKFIKNFESPKKGLDPLTIKKISDNYFLVPNFWKEQLFQFYIYSEEGQIVGYFGETGNKNGQFLSPTNFTYNSEGFIYVIEDRSNRIQKLKLKNFKNK